MSSLDDELVPASLSVIATVGRHEDGRAWLKRLPALVGQLQERWSLRLGAPFHGGSYAWVAPVRLPDGALAVLKVTWPHREAAGEADALALWDGNGAVRLYRHDRERHALLLERLEPGVGPVALGQLAGGEQSLAFHAGGAARRRPRRGWPLQVKPGLNVVDAEGAVNAVVAGLVPLRRYLFKDSLVSRPEQSVSDL